MSCQRGRKRSSYKRWLYDSDQLKPKVTQWRERKKTLRLTSNDSDQDESVWIDTSVEFEEINSDGDRAGLDVEEFLESSTSQFSNVCCGTTTVASQLSEDCFYQSEDGHVIHDSSDSFMDISNVQLEEGLPRVDVLEKQYEQLLCVIDKTPPHEDLTFVDTGVNLQEGLVDHNEDAGLTAFLEDFEESYYTDGDIKGDFNAKDTATSSTAELIYEGAQITYDESLLLTMAFALRHKISLAAVDDLLELLRIHCPKVNSMVPNISQFQQHFRKLNHPIKQHFCCPNINCQVYVSSSVPQKDDTCKVCGEHLSSKAFFIEVPVEQQLSTVLSRPGMIELLKYRFTRHKKDEESMEDVYDGLLYKTLSKPGGFLSNPSNISFLGNTDGVALIKSTGWSVWPVYLVVNEFPPLSRFSRGNRLFAGLWFGKGKPHFPTFLKPFAQSIRKLYVEGLAVPSGQQIKGMFLDITVDAPAKSLWLQIKQFNGYWGCSTCKEKGSQLVIGKGKKNRNRQCHIYPFNKSEPSTGHAATRTHTELKKQALEVCANKEAGKKDFSIEGVLGLCWGFAFPHFDVIKGTAIDYMHCICEGVVKQLLKHWFDKEKKNEVSSIYTEMDNVSSELISITPPSELTRRPRELKDKKDWKASEMKSFLLYYAIPLLHNVLPKCYLDHLMLLVGGVHRLLSSSISSNDLNDAGGFLKLFVAQSSTLYGDQFMTYNVHQLLHLKSDVENLGPLWTHSCFFFEDLNGDFRDLFHGTQNVNGQILQSVSTLQKLPELASEIHSPRAKLLYSHLIDKQHYNRKIQEEIEPGVYVLGGLTRVWTNSSHLSEPEIAILSKKGNWEKQWVFFRCQIDGVVYQCAKYKRVTARNNFTVTFKLSDTLMYGFIKTYVKAAEGCKDVACTEKHCKCENRASYWAIIEILDKHLEQPCLHAVKHVVRVKPTDRLVAVAISAIQEKCVCVNVSSGTWVCHLPNNYERD